MSITSANAVVTLVIPGLFPSPQQLQGFAADDVFDTDAVDNAEVMMGVDGILSAGFVFVPIKQNFSLQADSASNALFEAWYAAEQAAAEKYFCSGITHLPAIGRSYALTNGVLTSYKPTADAKKVLQPKRFAITWQNIVTSPF